MKDSEIIGFCTKRDYTDMLKNAQKDLMDFQFIVDAYKNNDIFIDEEYGSIEYTGNKKLIPENFDYKTIGIPLDKINGFKDKVIEYIEKVKYSYSKFYNGIFVNILCDDTNHIKMSFGYLYDMANKIDFDVKKETITNEDVFQQIMKTNLQVFLTTLNLYLNNFFGINNSKQLMN